MKCIFCGRQIKANDKTCSFCKQDAKPSYRQQKINGYACLGLGIFIMIISVVLIDEFEGLWGVLFFCLLLALSIIFICMPIALFTDYATSKRSSMKYEYTKKQLPKSTECSTDVSSKIDKNDSSLECASKFSTCSEDLIKLKELLDLGVISQEEFEAEKKNLLNL